MLDRFKVTDDIAVRVAPDDMRVTVVNLFRALGMPEKDATQAVDVLIYADVRGVDTHGVSNMVRSYVAGFQAGRINPTPAVEDNARSGRCVIGGLRRRAGIGGRTAGDGPRH